MSEDIVAALVHPTPGQASLLAGIHADYGITLTDILSPSRVGNACRHLLRTWDSDVPPDSYKWAWAALAAAHPDPAVGPGPWSSVAASYRLA